MYPPWQSRKRLTISNQLFYNCTQIYVAKSNRYLSTIITPSPKLGRQSNKA